MIDRIENVADRWLSLPERYREIRDLINVRDEKVFVLLGAPGSGKTTLLRHLQVHSSLEALRSRRDDIAVLLNLSQYSPQSQYTNATNPEEWLNSQFQIRFPNLPSISTLLRHGRLLLLLDGLNEIPHDTDGAYRSRIAEWTQYLAAAVQVHPGNRFVFSCRTLDYSAPLSTTALPVPHIRIEPMDEEQVQQFLDLNASFGISVWSQLCESKTLDYLRTPYLLQLLVEQIGNSRRAPSGRAELFSVCVQQALRRELETNNRLFSSGSLLSQRDRHKIARSEATGLHLSFGGCLLPQLSRLALDMQERTENREALQVRLQYDDACNSLGRDSEQIITAGCSIGVLEQDLSQDQVFFTHQLMQEYFAGRGFAADPRFEKVHVEWRAGLVSPSLGDTLCSLDETETLPPLPTTGWEETCRFAASLAHDQERFIGRLSDVNLALAAVCVAQPDVEVSESLMGGLRVKLLSRSTDPGTDLRARLASRRILAELGDPRFTRREGPLGPYLEPDFCRVPGGRYRIGSTEQNERPVHDVTLDLFEIGTFPVTNLEFKFFVESSAYDNESLWLGKDALSWLRGKGIMDLARTEWTVKRDALRIRPELPLTLYKNNRINLLQAISFAKLADMSEADFERLLREWYPDEPHVAPRFWSDPLYNHDSQPVVGVSWYEAAAYCRWLSIQCGREISLPTEQEWEAAARGQTPGLMYPYGNTFEADRANTSELHILCPNPVGIFPTGVSPSGCQEMSGCVFEWINNVFAPYRESIDSSESGNIQMVCRGGAWQHSQYRARAAYRGRGNPITRNNDLGFRLRRTSE